MANLTDVVSQDMKPCLLNLIKHHIHDYQAASRSCADDPIDIAVSLLSDMENNIMKDIAMLSINIKGAIVECQNNFVLNYTRIKRERARDSEKKFNLLKSKYENKLNHAKYVPSEDVSDYIASLALDRRALFPPLTTEDSMDITDEAGSDDQSLSVKSKKATSAEKVSSEDRRRHRGERKGKRR